MWCLEVIKYLNEKAQKEWEEKQKDKTPPPPKIKVA
jgi:hypothetical protein